MKILIGILFLTINNILLSIMASILSSTIAKSRGVFILFEGVDRCGKSTQAAMINDYLVKSSKSSELIRFPDRTSSIGQLINSYLQSTSQLSDQAIHLLFSANRWECSQSLISKLDSGVCDRYAFSGVAFSSAKGLDMQWCKSCDQGLPAPDCIIYLDIPVEDAAKRGNYGEERYEKIEFQVKIRDKFMALKQEDDTQSKIQWHVLDARKSIEELHNEIISIVSSTILRTESTEISKLWCN